MVRAKRRPFQTIWLLLCANVCRHSIHGIEMLVVGKLGQGWGSRVHDSYLTADEQYSHISLWCLLSSPLLIGCDMANMDDFTLNLLTNNEVIAVSQDPMVAPAKKMMVENGQVWSKKLYRQMKNLSTILQTDTKR